MYWFPWLLILECGLSVSYLHMCVFVNLALQFVKYWSEAHVRLTLNRGGPGAVVEDGELSEHLPRPHCAEFHALLGHLHLSI